MKDLLKIIKYLRPYWLQYTGAFLALVGITATQLVVPGIIRNVIDTGILKGEWRTMLTAGLTILGIGVLRALLSIVGRYLSETTSMKFSYELRNRLFHHVQQQSFTYHDHAQTGQLMSRFTEDIRSMQAFIGMGVVELLQVILLIIGSLILMLTENLILTGIVMIPIIILLILTADRPCPWGPFLPAARECGRCSGGAGILT